MEKKNTHRQQANCEFHMGLKQLMNWKQVHVLIWLREWPAHPVMILNYKLQLLCFLSFLPSFNSLHLSLPLPMRFLSCNSLQLISECTARLTFLPFQFPYAKCGRVQTRMWMALCPLHALIFTHKLQPKTMNCNCNSTLFQVTKCRFRVCVSAQWQSRVTVACCLMSSGLNVIHRSFIH